MSLSEDFTSSYSFDEGEQEERLHESSEDLQWTNLAGVMNELQENGDSDFHQLYSAEEFESDEEENEGSDQGSDEAIVDDAFTDGSINNVQAVTPSTSSLQNRRNGHSQKNMCTEYFGQNKPRLGWPMDELPIELFENIAKELARRDVLNMRLVNREFEKKISGFLFKAVVVPFQRQIYGRVTTRQEVKRTNGDVKGKGKAQGNRERDEDDQMEDQQDDKHDGMGIFQAWGPHIKKFAIAFEFDEGE